MALWQRIVRFFRVLWWRLRRPKAHAPAQLRFPTLRPDQMDEARRVRCESNSTDVRRILVQLGVVGERERLQARAQEMGYAFVDLDRVTIDPATLCLISAELAHSHGVLPLKRLHITLYLALNEPNLRAIDAVQVATGCRVIPVLATRAAIEQALHRHYPQENDG